MGSSALVKWTPSNARRTGFSPLYRSFDLRLFDLVRRLTLHVGECPVFCHFAVLHGLECYGRCQIEVIRQISVGHFAFSQQVLFGVHLCHRHTALEAC
jgi:hypothetical protein